MPLMTPPTSGVTVRMYRHGHGDCFLLCTPKANGEPFYILIDCGMKKKSEIKTENTLDVIIKDIETSTGGKIDIVLITHEHEDHVNGFLAKPPRARTRTYWSDIDVESLWLAWTEDGDDDFANDLRDRFDDTLLGLFGLTEKLSERRGFEDSVGEIDALLGFELAKDDPRGYLKASADKLQAKHPELSSNQALRLALSGQKNKEAIRAMRDKAGGRIHFLRPDKGPYSLNNVDDVRVFSLGPPRSEALLMSLDPKSHEEFKMAAGLDGATRCLFAATTPGGSEMEGNPFPGRHGIPLDDDGNPAAHPSASTDSQAFFDRHYGDTTGQASEWRRIDGDWLGLGQELALRLNSEVNNTSLVVAIELVNTGKVLLFTGDAQRGSWISWADLSWDLGGGERVTSRDLLARTVLYKVGHHGSHNATLKGTPQDDYPNLDWMAQGSFADEFTAMIPANEKWAMQRRPWPWKHPLKAIREALDQKARGKVFQSDIDDVAKPSYVTKAEWKRFTDRVENTDLFFECTILDE